ncbi:hypothetical protein TSUD_426440, partial [Trifolium subterraneum]
MNNIWKDIWGLQVTERNRHFLWIALHNRLLTNSIKARMRLTHEMCDYCRNFEETGLHVLRDCAVARELWMLVVPLNKRAEFFGSELSHWFQLNLQ